MKECKLGIVGWRDCDNQNRVWFEIDEAIKLLKAKGYTIIEIVSGIGPEEFKERGVDLHAREYAYYHNIKYKGFPAEWDNFKEPCVKKRNNRGEFYNALAGPNRNTLIVEYITHLLALPKKGGSPGTNDSISKARKLKKRLRIIEL